MTGISKSPGIIYYWLRILHRKAVENTGQPPQASPVVEISADICQEQLPAPAAAVIRKGNITIEVTESASAGFIQKVMEALADAW